MADTADKRQRGSSEEALASSEGFSSEASTQSLNAIYRVDATLTHLYDALKEESLEEAEDLKVARELVSGMIPGLSSSVSQEQKEELETILKATKLDSCSAIQLRLVVATIIGWADSVLQTTLKPISPDVADESSHSVNIKSERQGTYL